MGVCDKNLIPLLFLFFLRVLRELHSEYMVNAFFQVDVVPDFRVPGQNIIRNTYIYLYLYFSCISVCLFVSNKHKHGWTDRAKIVRRNVHYSREGFLSIYYWLKGPALPVGKFFFFNFDFFSLNYTPRPPMSVHKKIQPNRTSRLADYTQHIYIYEKSKFIILALEGAPRPSSKLVVNMFSLCTS